MEQNMSLKPFLFQNEYLVRSYVDDKNDIWLCGKDLCEVLDIKDSRDFIRTLDEDEKMMMDNTPDTIGRKQSMNFVSESAVYKLLFRSRKEIAKTFVRWITKEVIPSIRKTGSYTIKSNPLKEEMEMVQMLYDMHSKLGLDQRDEIFYKDRFRDFNVKLLKGNTEVVLPERVCLPLSDILRDMNYHYDRKTLSKFGKFVAIEYKNKYKEAPHKREQHVDGATRLVNHYTSEHKDFILECLRKFAKH